MALRTIMRNTVDTFLDWYLSRKLDKVLREYHLVKIIHLLRGQLDNDILPVVLLLFIIDKIQTKLILLEICIALL